MSFERQPADDWQKAVPGARWFKADANRGHMACSGAIEVPAVRDAIVRTVDGGEEAFRLRRRKYGF